MLVFDNHGLFTCLLKSFFYRIHFIYYHTSLILLTIKEKKIAQLLQFFIVSLSHGFDIFFKLKRKKRIVILLLGCTAL